MNHWWTHQTDKTPSRLEEVTLEELQVLLADAPARRDIQEIILHHTWKPTAAQYDDHAWWGIQVYHRVSRGWSDIGYHIGVGPDGTIWLLRPITRDGGHTKSHNANSVGVCVLGNYDRGEDDPTVPMRVAAAAIALLCIRYDLEPTDTYCHRDFANKSCPGTGIDRAAFRLQVSEAMGAEHPGREWAFETWREGDDLLGRGHATTWTDHTTASGTPADIPGLVACSLPRGRCEATAGSPFPSDLKWHTLMRVHYPATGRTVYCPLIDEGPAWVAEAGTGQPGSAMIDLTPKAKELLGFQHVNDNEIVKIRILPEQVWRPEMAAHMAALYVGERRDQ
jgi:hypothetical protein